MRVGLLTAVATAIAIGAIAITGGGGGAAGTANLWVNPAGAGASPSRCAVACAYDSTHAYGNLATAYTAASNGDNVIVKAGTTTAAFTGTKATGTTITFQPETDYATTLSSVDFANGTDNITLKNFMITSHVFQGGGVRSHDIVFQGNRIFYGIANTGAQVFNLHEVQNWTIDGNTFGPWCCSSVSNNSPEAIRLGSAPSSIPAVGDCSQESCGVVIKNNLFQYIGRTQTLWPSSGWGAVPDTTCSNVGDTCHMDAIHVFGAQNVDILNNRFYGVECQAVFFEQGGQPTMNANVNIIGNAISTVSGGCGNAGIILEFATGGADFGGTWNIAFNSGSSYIHSGDSGLSSFVAGSHLNFAGNYINNQTCDTSTANVTVTYNYNVWTSGACGGGTNTTGSTPAFIDSSGSPDPNIDVHVTGAAGTADNFVPTSFCVSNPTQCPTVDIDGTARPVGSAYDAGADER